ncbi:MAG: hypothetical protein KDI60_12300, partial [Xanthomonadales bacterium]|nr:hypothetical protein [Xanthomonadales bacterium]
LAKREAERKADEKRIAERATARGEADAKLAAKLDDGLNPGERGTQDLLDPEADKDEKRDVLLTEGARVLGDVIELLDENPRIADVSSGAAKAGLPPPPGT